LGREQSARDHNPTTNTPRPGFGPGSGKDDLVDKAREAAEDGAQRVLTELKERAAANPLARDWRGVSFTARRLRRC
jgi:hypothetical protein